MTAPTPAQSDETLREKIRKELFWITRGTLQMAENIRLNSEEDDLNTTFDKLDEQYYHQQYGEDDGSYRTQESEDAIMALIRQDRRELLEAYIEIAEAEGDKKIIGHFRSDLQHLTELEEREADHE